MNDKDLKLITSYANNLSYIFLSYGEYSDALAEKIIKMGIDIGSNAYRAIKAGKRNTIRKPSHRGINKINIEHPKTNTGDMYFYLQACNYAGVQVAEGTPEAVNTLISHVHRIPDKKA